MTNKNLDKVKNQLKLLEDIWQKFIDELSDKELEPIEDEYTSIIYYHLQEINGLIEEIEEYGNDDEL